MTGSQGPGRGNSEKKPVSRGGTCFEIQRKEMEVETEEFIERKKNKFLFKLSMIVEVKVVVELMFL